MGSKRALPEEPSSDAGSHKRRRPSQVSVNLFFFCGAALMVQNASHSPQDKSGASSDTTKSLQELKVALESVAQDPSALSVLSQRAGVDVHDLLGRVRRAAKDNGSVAVTTAVPPAAPPAPQPPPLPAIHDARLASAVFTHQAAVPSCDAADASLSYDRLEFLGDAYLETIASRLIFSRFPHLPPGRLSQIREGLINNGALAGHARHYGLAARVRVPERFALQGKTATKVHADVFEAYVAALVLQAPATGFAAAEAWLAALWAPALAAAHDAAPAPDPRAKELLARAVLSKGIRLDYVDARPPRTSAAEKGRATFFVDCLLTGWGHERKLLGSGQGLSKAQAGTRAAMQALENRPLVDDLAAMKRAFDQANRAKKEAEDEQSGAS